MICPDRVQAVEAHVHLSQRVQNGKSVKRRKAIAAQVQLLERCQLLHVFNHRNLVVCQRQRLELHAEYEAGAVGVGCGKKVGVMLACGRRVTMSLTSSTLICKV